MNKIILFVLLIVSIQLHADDAELIYQPKVLSPYGDEALEIDEHQWRLGLSLGQTMIENQSHTMNYGISANYLIWQRWYALARISEKQLVLSDNNGNSAIAWSFGAGYNVLEGAAYISKGLTLPWVMYGELSIGEQSIDRYAYGYFDGAIGLQLNNDETYAAIEWRYFNVDDKRLQQISSDKGYQWSLEFGRYF